MEDTTLTLQEQQLKRESSQVVDRSLDSLSRRLQSLLIHLREMRRQVQRLSLKHSGTPLYYIAANAGLEGAVIINKVKESAPGTGFNAATEEYGSEYS